jgi:hypothetical protein
MCSGRFAATTLRTRSYCRRKFFCYRFGMNTEEKNTREKFPTTPQELREFAKRLAYIAERYSDIAKQADLNEVKVLRVTGRPTAERGESFLVAWMKTLQAGLDHEVMQGSTNADEEELSKRPPPKKPKQPKVEK